VDQKSERRSFLGGALSGVLTGGGAGFLSGRESASQAAKKAAPAATPAEVDSFPHVSFAQQGEDLVIRSLLEPFKLGRPTYLDVGAHDPVRNSNTYLFYRAGGRGVLVEPNPFYADKLRKERPGDRVLAIGIGVTDAPQADYYMIHGDGQLNTFSKEQADWLVKHRGPEMLERVIKVPLVNINEVIADNFDVAPNVLSIDAEGFDLPILRSLDFAHYRPHVICAETLDGETGLSENGILEFLRSKGYSLRGATFVNTVFLSDELLKHRRPPADGGS
jgi:FkbM family methyltransferase